MKEHSQGGRQDPGPAPSRSWLLATGITASLGLILLWSTYQQPSLSPTGARETAQATPGSTRNALLRTERLPSSVAKALPTETLSTATTGVEAPLPATVEPGSIANHLAQLLSGTPDPDIGHLGAMIDIARDPALPLEERIIAIHWLARFGNAEAINALELLLLDDTSSPIRSAVATALGECPHPDATRLLVTLLDDEDPDVVLGAIRGLAMQRDPRATLALEATLADENLNDELRAAAATALGHHDDAAGSLRLALASAGGALASGALTGLARQPFKENEAIFRELFADPETPTDMKLEAIEALGEGTPEAANLLLELAGNADDPALRSAAVDALALFDEPGQTLNALGGLVLSEPSAEVRADLYNTLSLYADQANTGPDATKLVHSALSETAPRPQLEGYRMVASMLHDQYQSGLAETFDTSMVAWLQESAEHGGDQYTRHLSVDALRLANTPGAYQALLDLSYSADPAVSDSAQQALQQVAKSGVSHVP